MYSPDEIPEIRQRRLVYRIEPEPRLRIDNNPGVEPTTPEHNSSLDVQILVEYVL